MRRLLVVDLADELRRVLERRVGRLDEGLVDDRGDLTAVHRVLERLQQPVADHPLGLRAEHVEALASELLRRTHHDLLRRRVDLLHVDRQRIRDAEPLPLPDREAMHALVFAQDLADCLAILRATQPTELRTLIPAGNASGFATGLEREDSVGNSALIVAN